MNRVRFYYTLKELGEVTWAVRNCKRPKATREYKQLLKMLNEDSIESFGYYSNWGARAFLRGDKITKSELSR
tara:strand:+ start:382 stop:597 length:216 start_codon:yes stop_codon:yes gene_type:complete